MTKVAINIRILKDLREKPQIKDLFAIGMVLKLSFGSSALHYKSENYICKTLHIGHAKWNNLVSSEYFSQMFDVTEKCIIARNIHRRGEQISLVYEDGVLKAMIGRKVVLERKIEKILQSYNKVKKFLDELLFIVNAFIQQRAAHSVKPTPEDPENKGTKGVEKQGFVGCSYRRMADKMGVSRTRAIKIIGSCINEGVVHKERRRTLVLSTKGLSIGEADYRMDQFMANVEYEPGSKYIRTQNGIVKSMSNIYMVHEVDKISPVFKRYKRKNKVEIENTIEKLNLYEPDIKSNGEISSDEAISRYGEITYKNRVPQSYFDKGVKIRKSDSGVCVIKADKAKSTIISKTYYQICSLIPFEERKDAVYNLYHVITSSCYTHSMWRMNNLAKQIYELRKDRLKTYHWILGCKDERYDIVDAMKETKENKRRAWDNVVGDTGYYGFLLFMSEYELRGKRGVSKEELVQRLENIMNGMNIKSEA